MESFVVDTHALAWFIAEDERLSIPSLNILCQAEAGDAQVLVSTLVLAELVYIGQRKRVSVSIEAVLSRIELGNGFAIVPFDLVCLQVLLTLPNEWDIHDRIIAATAKYYDAVLISRDKMLRSSGLIQLLW